MQNERLSVEKEHLKKTIEELTDQILNLEDKSYENSKFVRKIKGLLEEKKKIKNYKTINIFAFVSGANGIIFKIQKLFVIFYHFA